MSKDLFGMPDPAADPDRMAWRQLVEQTLPALAGDRDWPIHLDHCFSRVLMDNAFGQPWRRRIPPPAWRNAPRDVLKQAIALGEAVIDGSEDLAALNRKSLDMRGKQAP